jgi:hypothetical protein
MSTKKKPHIRKLSSTVIEDLKTGILRPIREYISSNRLFHLAIRKGYFNVYYRGGCIMEVENQKSPYRARFDLNYGETEEAGISLPEKVINENDASVWVNNFPELTSLMDKHEMKSKERNERALEQKLARANSTLSQGKYIVTDIEWCYPEKHASVPEDCPRSKVDMLGVRVENFGFLPVLIEAKQGDSALLGDSGIIGHLKKMKAFLVDDYIRRDLLDTMISQLNQLQELGLVAMEGRVPTSDDLKKTKPEILFIFVDHDPKSHLLLNVINHREMDEQVRDLPYSLRFLLMKSTDDQINYSDTMDLDQLRREVRKV